MAIYFIAFTWKTLKVDRKLENLLKYILIHDYFQVSSLRISPSEISSEKETDLGLFSVDYFRNLSSYVLT